MNLARPALAFAASVLLVAPMVFAQQPGAPANGAPPSGAPAHIGRPGQGPMHRHQSTATRDQYQERQDEMQDFDQLGMPLGDFWQNPRLAQRIGLTPDQVSRLDQANLQGRLKIIQLDANLQMEQAKLDALFDAPTVDAAAALAQTDRVADARATIEKADAHLAFDLRAVLTPDQTTKLRDSRMHGRMDDGPGMTADGPGMQPHRQGHLQPMQPATAQ